MAYMQSLNDVWRNQSLARVPSLASDFGLYAYYVPWCIGEGTRDEGVYLVLSSMPVEDATKINIKKLSLELGEFPCTNTEITLIPLDAECKTDASKAERVVDAVMDYCKTHKALEDIFARYGKGTKMPKYISYIDEKNLRQSYAFANYNVKDWYRKPEICDLRLAGAEECERFCAMIQNYYDKYSKNPILRALKIPNKDYLSLSYQYNPRLVWHNNPIVRAVRYLRYHKSQIVPRKALIRYAGSEKNLVTIRLYSAYKHPGTGEMHRTGSLQAFEKEMAEKYPNILYSVKKLKPYKTKYVKSPDGEPTPFSKLPCYEQNYEVTFSENDDPYIAPIVNNIILTSDYRNVNAGIALHPKSYDDMVKAYGKENLIVRYVDCSNDIGVNVGLIAEQDRIPYALDDGTHYGCDSDGCVPYVFRVQDADYASAVIASVVNDFANNRGLPPDDRIVQAIDEPEAQSEENTGFAYTAPSRTVRTERQESIGLEQPTPAHEQLKTAHAKHRDDCER